MGMKLNMLWDKPCCAMFEYLADNDPAELLRLIDSSSLQPEDLTFAAEVAGRLPGELVVKSLLALLRHDSAVVREGAIYGLSNHRSTSVDTELQNIIIRDSSYAVREAAGATLKKED